MWNVNHWDGNTCSLITIINFDTQEFGEISRTANVRTDNCMEVLPSSKMENNVILNKRCKNDNWLLKKI